VGGVSTGPLYDALAAIKRLPPLTEAQAVAVYSEATSIDEFLGQYPPDDTGSSGLAVAKVAREHGWIESYSHAFSFNAALTGLQSAPLITGVNWYEDFDEPEPDGEMPFPNGVVRGGHELCVDELDVEHDRVWVTNSWGADWGLKGRAYWRFATWNRLLSEQGDATMLVPVPAPRKPDADGCLLAALLPWALRRHARDNAKAAKAFLVWKAEKGL